MSTPPLLCLVGLLATALTAACAPAESAPSAGDPPSADAVAFVGVNVVPMDRERVLEGQTVVVRDGRIAAIGDSADTPVPQGARRIAGHGGYLMPGLTEMHAHIPSPGSEREWGEGYVERVLFLYLANGVTTVRGMLGDPSHLALRERTASGELLAPRIVTSGPSFNGYSVRSPADAKGMVLEQKAAGYDFLKLHPGLSRAAFDTIDAVADREGIRYAGHVSDDVGLARALEAGQATVDHLDGYVQALVTGATGDPGFFGFDLIHRVDTSEIKALARRTREAGVWNVPTETLLENLAGPEPAEALAARPEMRYMPARVVAQWSEAKRGFRTEPNFSAERAARFLDVRHQLIRSLQEAGAGLLLGSDAPQIFNVPGFAAHRELEVLVEAGLTPFQALATGTRNPAVFFGEASESGTVEVGKRADLVLLERNPLEDVSATSSRRGVMVRGRWLPEEELQRRLEAFAAAR